MLFRGGLTLKDVEEQRGSNPFFIPEARRHGQMGEANYPEPSAHGIQPAWGLSISSAENIRLKDVRLETIAPDERQSLYPHQTKRIRLSGVTFKNGPSELPRIHALHPYEETGE